MSGVLIPYDTRRGLTIPGESHKISHKILAVILVAWLDFFTNDNGGCFCHWRNC